MPAYPTATNNNKNTNNKNISASDSLELILVDRFSKSETRYF